MAPRRARKQNARVAIAGQTARIQLFGNEGSSESGSYQLIYSFPRIASLRIATTRHDILTETSVKAIRAA